MKSREMRMQFRPLNGFEKQYKVNYLGEIYSIKYKKLKEMIKGEYHIRKNGRVYFISKLKAQKMFFQALDKPVEEINIYNKIKVKKLIRETDFIENVEVYIYNKNKFDKSLIIGNVLYTTKEHMIIELYDTEYEEQMLKNHSDYRAYVTYKDNIIIELLNDQQLELFNSKNYTEMELDNKFRGKHPGTRFATKEQILDIYKKCYSGKFKDVEIAEEYGVNVRVIVDIKYGYTFNDITHHREKLLSKYNFEKGSSRYNSIIDEKVALEIYKLANNKDLKIPIKDIARGFNVNSTMVSRIKNGKTWNHVTQISNDNITIKKTHKLSKEQIIDIYNRARSGDSIHLIAKNYNISTMTVYNIKNKKTCKDILRGLD